jgi:hypothetical protein
MLVTTQELAKWIFMSFYNGEFSEKLHSHVSFHSHAQICMPTSHDNLHVLLRDLKCNLLYIYQNENSLNEYYRGEWHTDFICNVIFTSLMVFKTARQKHLSNLCSKHTELGGQLCRVSQMNVTLLYLHCYVLHPVVLWFIERTLLEHLRNLFC